MTQKHRKIFIVLLVVSVLSFAGLLAVTPSLPEQIPIHWNFEGDIDGYGNKWMTAVLGALPPLMLLMFWALPKIDPGKENYKKHMGPYLGVMIFVTLLLVALCWMTVFAAWGIHVPVERIVPVLVGLLLIFLGNYMPRIRHNYTFGIRTPWTLASETVWRKTHRFGSIWFVVGGVLMLLTAFIQVKWLVYTSIGVIIVSVIFVMVYSWYLFQKEQKNHEEK